MPGPCYIQLDSWFFKKFFFGCAVFIATCGLSLVAASRGYSSLMCMSCSLQWALGASAVVTRALECRLLLFTECGIFLHQGLNSYLLHWPTNLYPLHHQGSPWTIVRTSCTYVDHRVEVLEVRVQIPALPPCQCPSQSLLPHLQQSSDI